MFFKKHNKKGFTLIEMMAVIAIIAIIVGIMVPVVTSYTNRASAAANAANLRTVKGQVSTMLLSGQITYQTSALADYLIASAQAEMAKAEAALATATRYSEKLYYRGIIAGCQLTIATAEAGKNANNTYYAENGEVNVDGVVLNAPVAKGIKIGDMTLPEGTEMIILVTDNEVTVTYNGLPLEVIALVAEGGDDTEINWDEYPHTYVDDDGNWTCDYCGIGAFSHG